MSLHLTEDKVGNGLECIGIGENFLNRTQVKRNKGEQEEGWEGELGFECKIKLNYIYIQTYIQINIYIHLEKSKNRNRTFKRNNMYFYILKL